jgi:hypothetical protein
LTVPFSVAESLVTLLAAPVAALGGLVSLVTKASALPAFAVR